MCGRACASVVTRAHAMYRTKPYYSVVCHRQYFLRREQHMMSSNVGRSGLEIATCRPWKTCSCSNMAKAMPLCVLLDAAGKCGAKAACVTKAEACTTKAAVCNA